MSGGHAIVYQVQQSQKNFNRKRVAPGLLNEISS